MSPDAFSNVPELADCLRALLSPADSKTATSLNHLDATDYQPDLSEAARPGTPAAIDLCGAQRVAAWGLDWTLPESRLLFESRSAGDRYLAEIEGAGRTSYMELCTRIEYADVHHGPESQTVFDIWVDETCTDEYISDQEAVDLTSFYAAAFFGRYILGK